MLKSPNECDAANLRASAIPVQRYRYKAQDVDPAATRLGRNYTTMSDRGVTVARAALQMRASGYVPDVIFGHSGWGEAGRRRAVVTRSS